MTTVPAAPFDSVLDALCASNPFVSGSTAERPRLPPSPAAIAGLLADLRAALFPGHFGGFDPAAGDLRSFVARRLDRAQNALRKQIRRGLAFACRHPMSDAACRVCDRRAEETARALLERLPALRDLLETDVQAAFHGDPAARFVDETLFCYPGVTAIVQHRIAHELFQLAVPLVPRMISELAHSETGIDIHPGATIGRRFFIDHGTGVVIGETCIIGDRVRLYQGVTLGARGFPSDDQGHPLKGLPRHPLLEDDVVIFAGATILGRITIGRGATIGANVWLNRSVPAGARVTQTLLRNETFEEGERP
jgi:serine O-acetyltransferase